MSECGDLETCSDQEVGEGLHLAELGVPPESQGQGEGVVLEDLLLGAQMAQCDPGGPLISLSSSSSWTHSLTDTVRPGLRLSGSKDSKGFGFLLQKVPTYKKPGAPLVVWWLWCPCTPTLEGELRERRGGRQMPGWGHLWRAEWTQAPLIHSFLAVFISAGVFHYAGSTWHPSSHFIP